MTIWQAVRGFGARRCRYMGAAKTQLQQVLTATAVNFVRMVDWLVFASGTSASQLTFVKPMAQPVPC